jgi:hypothetical protein
MDQSLLSNRRGAALMEDIFSDLVSQLETAIIKERAKPPKQYKPSEKTINRIGKLKDVRMYATGFCTDHLKERPIHRIMEDFAEFVGIPRQKITMMNNESKTVVEQKILNHYHAAREGEVFYADFFNAQVYPSYRRLEFLFKNQKGTLITDAESLEMSDHYQTYFEYLLKIGLELPISDECIENTFLAILAIVKPAYSQMNTVNHHFSTEFIGELALRNKALQHKLLKVAMDWYRVNKPFKFEVFPVYVAEKYTYLLTDDELAAAKLRFFDLVSTQYKDYKDKKSYKSPNEILSTIKTIRSMTNNFTY